MRKSNCVAIPQLINLVEILFCELYYFFPRMDNLSIIVEE